MPQRSAAGELTRLGGARVIVATAPNSAAISELVGGLGRNRMLLAIAAPTDPMTGSPVQLIGRRAYSRLARGGPQGFRRDNGLLRSYRRSPDD
jgi:hypothetical protein